jgi:hypothetical protein
MEKSPCLMGKFIISMAIFNRKLLNYQRVLDVECKHPINSIRPVSLEMSGRSGCFVGIWSECSGNAQHPLLLHNAFSQSLRFVDVHTHKNVYISIQDGAPQL